MTPYEWLAVMGVLAALLAGLPLLRKLCQTCGTSAEVARKSVHVAMGMACAAFPWIFDRPLPVWILAALATLPLVLLRWVPALREGVGSALHGVKRVSYGEILFAPAVAAVFDLSNGDPLLHAIPVGILTVADAAGAIAGTRWGHRFYVCGTGRKSAEGSAAFLVVAFLCTFLPLWLGGRTDTMHSVAIALTLAIVSMMAEGISDRGFDNLVIPLGCHFLLARFLESSMVAMEIRFGAAVILLALVAWGSRWSTLSGSALIGGALLGYGCAILADPRFLLPLLAIFICHLVTTRRHRLGGTFDHRLDAVISHAIGTLPWCLAVDRGLLDSRVALVGLSFAMAIHLAITTLATRRYLYPGKSAVLHSVLKGWVIAGHAGLIWLWRDYRALALPTAIALALTPAVALLSEVLESRLSAPVAWTLRGTLALLCSTPALLLLKQPVIVTP
jgi:phytol kinase